MSGRRVLKIGNYKLYQFGDNSEKVEERCKQVPKTNEAIRTFINTMKTLAAQQGFVSLSANQLAKNHKIFIALKQQVLIPGKWKGYQSLVVPEDYETVLNAQVTGSAPYQQYMYEQCSSYPLFKFKMKRPIMCKIKWKNQFNQKFHEQLTGFRLRVWQHELAHMQGQLLTHCTTQVDLAEDYRDTLYDQQFQFMKEYMRMLRQQNKEGPLAELKNHKDT